MTSLAIWIQHSSWYFVAAAIAGAGAGAVCTLALLVALIRPKEQPPSPAWRRTWWLLTALAAAPGALGVLDWASTTRWLSAYSVELDLSPGLVASAYEQASHGLTVGAAATLLCWCLLGLGAIRTHQPSPDEPHAPRARALATVVVLGMVPLILWSTATWIRAAGLMGDTAGMASIQLRPWVARVEPMWAHCTHVQLGAAVMCAVVLSPVLLAHARSSPEP